MSSHHPIIIIGAGLSGLYAAWTLHQQGKSVCVLEARERCGGRILSPLSGKVTNEKDSDRVDLGPAWVWPEFQPRLEQLAQGFNIRFFKQFTEGDMLYEADANNAERYSDQSAHDMSFRIEGGAYNLIATLQQALPDNVIQCQQQVNKIERIDDDTLKVHTIQNSNATDYTASQIILALPLRLCQQAITFSPTIPDTINTLWENTPTWMASHCKFIFIYETPFWREEGLSGEVFSRFGPLTEIYDGSPLNESYFALTAFVGIDAGQRQQLDTEQLTTACLAQLKRLFGEKSQHVLDIKIKDWSQDPLTCTADDIAKALHHPQYPHTEPRSLWDNRLILAGTEVARTNGGYLEGALESADEAIACLNRHNT